MMGSDIKKLQELINSLEEVKKIEDKKMEEATNETENTTTEMTYNTTNTNVVE